MKVLVCIHDMGLGGCQLNAIELADGVAQLGHEVVVYGPAGPLNALVSDLGLEMVIGPPATNRHPAVRASRELRRLAAERSIDLVHTYEWSTTLDAAFGPGLFAGVPVLSTVMSMDVPPYVPRDIPLIVGTKQICDLESTRRPWVRLLEPPVNTDENAHSGRGAEMRLRWAVGSDELLLVVVSRLIREMKGEGIAAAIRLCGRLAEERKLRLVVVGDGSYRGELQRLAEEANALAGRDVVLLAGPMTDPRDAYDAADIALGMGGSALRAMAFSKPVIVQGEAGYWKLLTPQTLGEFLFNGFWGIGDGTSGEPRLRDALDQVFESAELRHELGQLGRQVVCERFSLAVASQYQEQIYLEVLRRHPDRHLGARLNSLLPTLAQLLRIKLAIRTRLRRVRAGLTGTRNGRRFGI